MILGTVNKQLLSHITDNIKMDRIPTKIKRKIHPFFTFQGLKVLLIKICKIQPPGLLFLFVFISFYISRYPFSQIFRTLFNNIWKKYFHHKFFFFNGFAQILPPTTPLNSQNLLSMTKVFCWCSLIIKAWFFKVSTTGDMWL